MKELLEAGAHFGHQTRRWNPKMSKYIFGARNGIHIIDMQTTLKKFKEAYAFAKEVSVRKGKFLFVGTKRQAQALITEEAKRCGMFYLNKRWLGGTLTNFATIKKSIGRLKSIERMKEDGTYDSLLKKETIKLDKELAKFNKFIGGIKDMISLPDVIFVIDPRKEKIALTEANKLGIPVIAVVDTNCDPEKVDYVIPANDDAIRSIRLFASKIAEAIIEGKKIEEAASAKREEEEAREETAAPEKPVAQKEEKKKKQDGEAAGKKARVRKPTTRATSSKTEKPKAVAKSAAQSTRAGKTKDEEKKKNVKSVKKTTTSKDEGEA